MCIYDYTWDYVYYNRKRTYVAENKIYFFEDGDEAVDWILNTTDVTLNCVTSLEFQISLTEKIYAINDIVDMT